MVTLGMIPVLAPLETPAASISDTSITPGVTGFLVTFALALACWLLFRSMTRHVRKVKHGASQAGAASAGPVSSSEASPPGPTRNGAEET